LLRSRAKIGAPHPIFAENIVSRVRDRRFVAVDRERGIVFAFAFFDHEQVNWTWQLGELFKIQDGKIRRLEASFQRAPTASIPDGARTSRVSRISRGSSGDPRAAAPLITDDYHELAPFPSRRPRPAPARGSAP
jgi:hypothetical protein